MNQNPFKSMFWAAQGMAAEMSTGVLVMQAIDDSKRKVSMLVTHQEAIFLKKQLEEFIFLVLEETKLEMQFKESIKQEKVKLLF